MNTETAKYLNKLLKQAVPVTLQTKPEGILLYPHNAEIADRIGVIVESHVTQALIEEIQDAAKERRAVNTHASYVFYCGLSGLESGCSKLICSALSYRAHKLALPEIEAVLAAHNAATLAAYESYRLACEQGVAVPPQSQEVTK
jgi:hypothetical protein